MSLQRCPRHCHLFLSEIKSNSALAEASNEYLAKYFEVSERTIQRWIKTLQEKKLIVCEYISKIKRKITSVFSKTTTSVSEENSATPYNIYVYNTRESVDKSDAAKSESVVECIFNKMRGFGIARRIADDVIKQSKLSLQKINGYLDYLIKQSSKPRWKNLRNPAGYVIYSIKNNVNQKDCDHLSFKKGVAVKAHEVQEMSTKELKQAVIAERAHHKAQKDKSIKQARAFEKWREQLSKEDVSRIVGSKKMIGSILLKNFFFEKIYKK